MVIDSQNKRLDDAKQLLSNVEGKQRGIKDRISRAFKVYELLEQRLQNFRMLPGANKKPLSRAEREFKTQLGTQDCISQTFYMFPCDIPLQI